MNKMYDLANELIESVQDYTYAYMNDYPEPLPEAVSRELLGLAQVEFVRNEARAIAEVLTDEEGSRTS